MPAKIVDLELVFASVVSSLLALSGFISVLMFLYGAVQKTLAGADKDANARSSATMLYAGIGLLVSMSAWMVLNLFGNFLGVSNLGVFRITL